MNFVFASRGVGSLLSQVGRLKRVNTSYVQVLVSTVKCTLCLAAVFLIRSTACNFRVINWYRNNSTVRRTSSDGKIRLKLKHRASTLG